jgi:GxxExxY protein
MVEPSPEHNRLAREIVDSAFAVHAALGPGLLESIYEECKIHESGLRSIPLRRQFPVPITYKGVEISAGLRLDLIVGDRVIVELKAVERLLPVHEAQLLSYLKLSGLRLGLLINFDAPPVKDGIRRLVRRIAGFLPAAGPPFLCVDPPGVDRAAVQVTTIETARRFLAEALR